jgi:hypothetical protein
LKYTASSAATTPVDVRATPISFIDFTMLPPSDRFASAADDGTQRALELNTEKFELTCRCAKTLRVGHKASAVEQRDHSIFAIEKRLQLLVDPPHITAE